MAFYSDFDPRDLLKILSLIAFLPPIKFPLYSTGFNSFPESSGSAFIASDSSVKAPPSNDRQCLLNSLGDTPGVGYHP